jgi:uncharacterized protein DUF1236/SH3 domain-containing protein
MQIKSKIFMAAVTAAAISAPALAATLAEAMTPLNIRSGPGPQFSIVGAIPTRGQATIIGCIQDSLWCQVSYNGRQGWVYSQYLTARLSGRSLIVAEHLNDVAPATVYRAPVQTVGSAMPPPITGTLVAPQAGAAVVVAPPPATVGDYVISHPVTPVYLNGEVVEGVGLPQDVVLAPIPGSDYDYAYVNNVPVLVEPTTRRVEYLYR